MADDPDIPFQKNPEALFPELIEKLPKNDSIGTYLW